MWKVPRFSFKLLEHFRALGNEARLCPFGVIFSAEDDCVLRAEHAQLYVRKRYASLLSKTRDILRDGSALRKRCSALN